MRLKSGRGNHHELGNGVMGMFLLFNPAFVSGCLACSDAEFFGKGPVERCYLYSFVHGGERLMLTIAVRLRR